MKVEEIIVTAIEIKDVPGLDPVRVLLHDMGAGRGRIIIGCYGRAWENYWDAMGCERLMDFLVECDADYIADKLTGMRQTKREQAYLLRIVKAVQEGLREYKAVTEGGTVGVSAGGQGAIDKEEREILWHTVHRAAGGRYCGGGPAMGSLVAKGLMQCIGTPGWAPDSFYTITRAGVEALRAYDAEKTGAPGNDKSVVAP